MTLKEAKKLYESQAVEVDMGYKYCNSRYAAHFIRTETVPSVEGEVELCVVKPCAVVESKCDWAEHCVGDLMLVDPEQILKTL